MGINGAVGCEVPQDLDVRGRLIQVIHAFVETGMGGGFYGQTPQVEVIHDRP